MIKRKATIRCGKLTYDDNSDLSLDPLPKIDGFFVDFEGWNEGSGSPCKDKQEMQEIIKRLLDRHSQNYKIQIINELEQQQTIC